MLFLQSAIDNVDVFTNSLAEHPVFQRTVRIAPDVMFCDPDAELVGTLGRLRGSPRLVVGRVV